MQAGAVNMKFMADILDVQAKMKAMDSAVSGAMGGIEKAVGIAKNALIGFAGIATVGTFANMIKGSIDAIDNLNDLSKTTGISVENLSGLQLASKQTGGDLVSLAASINKLSVNMGKDGEAFKKLGVDAKDPLEAFKQFSDVFSKIDDPQTRAALGAAALGKSWADAAPLLMEGSKNIQDMVDKGIRLAGVTQEMANKADAFNDKLAELEAASTGTKMKIADELLPAMIGISTAMGTAYEEGGKLKAIWVALGGLGALMFTNEFQTTASKVKDLNAELAVLYAEKKAQEKTPAFGLIHKYIYGENYIEKDIETKTAQIKAMQDQLDRPRLNAQKKLADSKAQAKADAEAADALAKATEFLKLNEAATKKAIAEKERALKAQDSFIASLQKEHDNLILGTGQSKLHEAAVLGITGAKLRLVEALIEEGRAYKEAIETSKIRTDLRKKESDGIDAYMVSLTDGYQAAEKGSQNALEAAQREYDQFGKTRSQIEQITLATLEGQLATKIAGTEAYESVLRRITAQQSLIDVLQKGEARDIAIKHADEVAKAWEHTTKAIGDGLSSALTDALFEGRSLWDAFKNYLINTILDGAIKNALSSVIQSGLNSMFGTSMFGSAAGSAAGAAGANGWAGLGALFSGSGAGAGAGAGAISTGVVGGGAGAAIGTDLGLLGSGAGGAGAGAGAGAAGSTGLGSMAGFLPYLGAAAALLWVGDAIKNKARPAEVIGGGAMTDLANDYARIQESYSGFFEVPIHDVSYQKLHFLDTDEILYQIMGDGIPVGIVDALEKADSLFGNGFIRRAEAFVLGGDFSGGWRLVGENGPELEATGPSRIFDAPTTASMLRSGGANNSELVEEMRLLRLEVQGLRTEAESTGNKIASSVRKSSALTVYNSTNSEVGLL